MGPRGFIKYCQTCLAKELFIIHTIRIFAVELLLFWGCELIRAHGRCVSTYKCAAIRTNCLSCVQMDDALHNFAIFPFEINLVET